MKISLPHPEPQYQQSATATATIKKKRHYTKNRIGRQPQQRVTCTVCLKPGAVWYYQNKKKNSIIYEHRDEPPIKEFTYRGKKMKRYRRCNTTFTENPIESVLKNERKEIMQQQQEQKQMKKEQQQSQDWQKLYADLIHELKGIVYDIDGETAIRMIKNIRRMLDHLAKNG